MKHITELEKLPTGYMMRNEPIRKLITENPDLPLVFIATDEACSYDFQSMFCSSVTAEIGEVLDCQQTINDEIVYTDRDDFEDEIFDQIETLTGYDDRPEEWYQSEVKRIAAEYDPYWRKAIIITVSN